MTRQRRCWVHIEIVFSIPRDTPYSTPFPLQR
nr:MAG TPA: hypothetical protein [Caudoviricetes sp.]